MSSVQNPISESTNALSNAVSAYDEQLKIVKNLKDAQVAVTHDGSGKYNKEKVLKLRDQYEKAIVDLDDITKVLISVQNKTNADIKVASDNIVNYKNTLQNNNVLFNTYGKKINNKKQLIATHNRMLQLSQNRNIYKKKIIYTLFSIIIALLISVISVYTLFM